MTLCARDSDFNIFVGVHVPLSYLQDVSHLRTVQRLRFLTQPTNYLRHEGLQTKAQFWTFIVKTFVYQAICLAMNEVSSPAILS